MRPHRTHYRKFHGSRVAPHWGKGRREQKLFLAAAIVSCSLTLVFAVVLHSGVSSAKQKMKIYPKPETDMSQVTLLAPRRQIRQGTKLQPVDFHSIYWPKSQVPEGAIREVGEITDKYARASLAPDAPVIRDNLTIHSPQRVLSPSPGNRAVTLNIDAVSGIEYHVVPGSIVDVVLTHFRGHEVNSKVIVEQARVLSLGGTLDKKTGRHRNIRSHTVTLDVAPHNALKIVNAKSIGSLSLMMRESSDVTPLAKPHMSSPEVMGTRVEPKPTKKPRTVCGRAIVRGKKILVDC